MKEYLVSRVQFFIASQVTRGMTRMCWISLLDCFYLIASFNFILCHSTYGKTLCLQLFLLLPFKYSGNDPMNIKKFIATLIESQKKYLLSVPSNLQNR